MIERVQDLAVAATRHIRAVAAKSKRQEMIDEVSGLVCVGWGA